VGTPISYNDIIGPKVADAPGVGGVGADLRDLLTRTWRDAADYQRFVYKVAAALFLAGVFHGLVWGVLGGSMTETVSWRKPTLFLLSAGLSVATWAFVMSFLRITRRQGWQLAMCVVIPATTVGALSALQQWRGTRSHFNFFESTLNTVIAGIIPLVITLLVPTIAAIAVMTFRSLRPGVPRTLALALRAGMVLMNVSFLMGIVTILNGVTNGLLFTIHVPSVIGAGGTTKVAHGLPLHGIQIFLLIVGLLSYAAWNPRRRLTVLWLAVVGYVGMIAVFVFQSVSGREPFDFNTATRLALAISIALLVVSVGTAATAAVRAIRRGARSQIFPTYPWSPATSDATSEPIAVGGFFDRKFLKAGGVMLLFLGGMVGVSAGIGSRLPSSLVFTRTAWLDAPPDKVWALVTDHANEPSWRRELTSMRTVGQRNGRTLWQEQYWSFQKIDLDTVEQSERPDGSRRLVYQMSFHALPVLAGGVRVIDVVAAGRGTRVTVREEKVVRVPPFRTWARIFVLPQLSTVTPDRYLAALGARVGQTPKFE
jgi:hypothetical protein